MPMRVDHVSYAAEHDGLDETAARMGSQDFVWVTQAVAINREVGGNLAEVLDGVGHTIRERNQIRRQVKALAAEGIPVSNGYVPPLYRQATYQQRIALGDQGYPWKGGPWDGTVSYEDGICPTAERLHDHALMLADVTRHPLTAEDIDDVAAGLEKVLGNLDRLAGDR